MIDPLARLEVRESEDGETLLLTVHGEIDSSNADDLERRMAAPLAPGRAVALDLGPVRYIDSQGARLVLRLADRVAEGGGRLVVVAPPGSAAADLVRLTRIDDLVEVVGALPGPDPA